MSTVYEFTNLRIYACRPVGAVGAAHDSDRAWSLSGITVGLSGLLSDYCRTTVGLSGSVPSVGLLSEVTVGLSDRGSGGTPPAPNRRRA